MKEAIRAVARAIRGARTLIVTAGAGMGVDSALPDFRGNDGFWRAYPPYRSLGLSFVDAANPEQFHRNPAFAWGFYGHRLNLYRNTIPHEGFALIEGWVRRFDLDRFVVTSNVDGQFQKAGLPDGSILEVHGSIRHLQCLSPCTRQIWPVNADDIPVDEATMRAKGYPRCPSCGGAARPNILMFGDSGWLSRRTDEQGERFADFLACAREGEPVVLECGAGTGVPTIRRMSENLVARYGATLIRINPREHDVPRGHIALACGALEGLKRIDEGLHE